MDGTVVVVPPVPGLGVQDAKNKRNKAKTKKSEKHGAGEVKPRV